MRLAIAASLGAAIGVERELNHRMAGLKTNALVAMGASLFMMLAYGPIGSPDVISRVGAQIVTGIGFLGGGVIMRDGLHVRGLTTAATLWCAAAIGVLAGSGARQEPAIGCAAVLAINIALKPVSKRLGGDWATGEGISSRFKLRVQCAKTEVEKVRSELNQLLTSRRLHVMGVRTDSNHDDLAEITVDMMTGSGEQIDFEKVASGIDGRHGIRVAEWQRMPSA